MKAIDAYEFKARLLPALIATAPILTLVAPNIFYGPGAWQASLGVVSLFVLIAAIVRRLGRRAERRLCKA